MQNIARLKNQLTTLLREEKAQGEWGAVYLLLVLIIAAIVLISIIKPMFQQSQEVVSATEKAVTSS